MYKYLFLIYQLPQFLPGFNRASTSVSSHETTSASLDYGPVKGNPAKAQNVLSQTLYLYTIFPKSQGILLEKLVKTTIKNTYKSFFDIKCVECGQKTKYNGLPKGLLGIGTFALPNVGSGT